MPTSSQALILQAASGAIPGSTLPQIIQRRHCSQESELPDPEREKVRELAHFNQTSAQLHNQQPMLPVSSTYEMATAVQLKADINGQIPKQRKNKVNKNSRIRPFGSLPVLEYKVDFSTLPQLLSIRGIHGSVKYNHDNRTLSWRVNTIGPFYERMNQISPRSMRNKGIPPVNMLKLQAVRGSRRTPRLAYTHGDSRKQRLLDENPRLEGIHKTYRILNSPHCAQAVVSGQARSDFFKLVYTGTDPETGQMTYSLRVCDEDEPGSFRLMSVRTGEEDDLKAKSQRGLLADTVRPPDEGNFVILKQDKGPLGEVNTFQSLTHKVSYSPYVERGMNWNDVGPAPPRRAWDVHVPTVEFVRDNSGHIYQIDPSDSNISAGTFLSTENQYGTLENSEERVQINSETKITSQDISNGTLLYSGSRQGWTESPSSLSGRPSPIGRYGVPLKPHHGTETSDLYMQNLSTESPEMYNKLVSLGFRKVKDTSDNDANSSKKVDKNKEGEDRQHGGPEWKSHNFDKWSRTTLPPSHQHNNGPSTGKSSATRINRNTAHVSFHGNDFGSLSRPRDPSFSHISYDSVPGMKSFEFMSSDWKTHHFDHVEGITDASSFDPSFAEGENITYLKQTNAQTRFAHAPHGHERKTSLIDEVKLKANYKQWKKKKITTLRMRKEMPPKDACAVVLRLADNVIPHDRLKCLIEKSTGSTLKSLQFDPVSVHSIDCEAKSQWILRFKEEAICENLVTSGLRIDDVTWPVRRFNDVMKEEHEAYMFYEMIKLIKERKQQKPNKSKNTETQTGAILDVTQNAWYTEKRRNHTVQDT